MSYHRRPLRVKSTIMSSDKPLSDAEQSLRDAANEYHRLPTRGKISVTPTKPLSNQRDLSLAYSPGVAYPCLEIQADPAGRYVQAEHVLLHNEGDAAVEPVDAFGDLNREHATPVVVRIPRSHTATGPVLLWSYLAYSAFALVIAFTDWWLTHRLRPAAFAIDVAAAFAVLYLIEAAGLGLVSPFMGFFIFLVLTSTLCMAVSAHKPATPLVKRSMRMLHELVMASVKMFSEIVGQVFLARMPSNVEISKFDLLSDPKEILFHGS